MTTPICCARCQHWKKHRENNCNWGVCNKINAEALATDLAVLNPIGVSQLNTRDTFYCPMFQAKPTEQKNNIVAAVQQAARDFHRKT